MNFSEQAIKEFEVGEKADAVKEMIYKLIHNQEDLDALRNLIAVKCKNKIYHCLCEYAKVKNKTYEHSA